METRQSCVILTGELIDDTRDISCQRSRLAAALWPDHTDVREGSLDCSDRHWQERKMAKADLIRLSSNERRQSGLSTSRCPVCRWWVLFTSQSVTLSLSFCCFTEPSNLSTRRRGFCMLAHSAGQLGGWTPQENVCLWVQIVPWRFQSISSTFTPWKSHISVLFGVPPPFQVAFFWAF